VRKLILVLAITLLSAGAFSQTKKEPISVKGQIIDSLSGESIPYTTISIFKLPETKEAVKRLASTVNGEFSFELSHAGDYILEISSIEIKSFQKKFTINAGDVSHSFGVISIGKSDNEIAQVDVVSQKQLITVEADKIVYNTEADPDSKTSTAMDLMRRVPLVSVDGDDNIQLKGSSNFKIYMNGKPSPMLSNNPKEVLSSLSASSIKNIEVISSPGAKYDAEGVGGIINIITTKQVLSGYSGSVNSGINSLGRYNTGAMFSAAIKKFVFSVNVGNMYNSGQENHSDAEQENYYSTTQRYNNSEGTGLHEGFFNRVGTSFSYELDTLNLISGAFNFWNGNFDSNSENSTNISGVDFILNQAYQTNNTSSNTFGNSGGNIDYQRNSKKDKNRIFTLSYKMDNSPRDRNNHQEIISNLNFYNYKENVNQKEKGLEQTFQADYVHPLSKTIKLETGAKYILRNNNSKTTAEIFDFDNEIYVDDSEQNIDFEHTQSILAAYVSFDGNFKKFGYKAGIRVEDSKTDGIFKIGNSNDFNSTNLEYVPSLSLSYKIDQKQNLQLSYAKRIQRPSIWFLNPYIDDSNPKSVRYGNPELDPERFHQVDLNYNIFMKMGNINISSFYSYSNNGINSISWVDNNDIIYTTYQNIALQHNLGGSLNMNLRFGKKISLSTNFSSRYVMLENLNNENQTNSGWNHGGFSRLQYNLNKTIKLSVNGGVWSQSVQLQSTSSAFYFYGLSFTKEFFDQKLSLTIDARDFLQKEKVFSNELSDNNFYQMNNFYRPARNFGLNLSYRFGEMKTQVKKVKKTIQNNDVKGGEGENQGTGE